MEKTPKYYSIEGVRLSTIVMIKPEDVFKKWIKSLDRKTFEKYFVTKKAKLTPEKVSPVENIEKIEKNAFAIMFVTVTIKSRAKPKKATIKEATKIQFYDYPVMKDVPIFKTITLIRCDHCNGTGTETCDKCKGTGKTKCSKCGGTGRIKCDRCGGKGKITLKVKVKISEKKTETREITVNCPKCHGKGWLVCPTCGGTGSVVCNKCGGSGKISCKTCGGHGQLIQFKIGPTATGERTLRYPSPKKLIDEKYFEKILKSLGNVKGVEFSSLEELDNDYLMRTLGFVPPNLDTIKRELKAISEKLKKEGLTPRIKIVLYPVLKLYLKTQPKGRKALLYGIGTTQAFSVVQVK